MSWKFVENVANMNVVSLLKRVLSEKETQDFLINLNTEVQLFENNENSLGIKLFSIGGEYSNRTLSLSPEKKKKEITLHDTGEFYSSFIVHIEGNGDFSMLADPFKTDENGFTSDLRDRWSSEIIGLTKENHKKVIEFLEKRVLQTLCK